MGVIGRILIAHLRAMPEEGIVLSDKPGIGYQDAVLIPKAELDALLDVVEAAREAAEELSDAIASNVNGGDLAGWTQADYERWDAARDGIEVALARFDFDGAA